MAMAGMDYKECGITFEEWDDQHSQEHTPLPPPTALQAECDFSVNVDVESMKVKLRQWAKAVASNIKQTLVSFDVTKNEMIRNNACDEFSLVSHDIFQLDRPKTNLLQIKAPFKSLPPLNELLYTHDMIQIPTVA
ncbi:hypothetical protein PIB30_016888 [Stylosanthes scabra]|uniref:Uncharacterized protein n=1 Tax=Stylosanthes scabra TaxID=79078 RepID=A0ABU6V9P9_9FABA|nr:hypothetical protein [Stylosanthes scabra]